MRVGLLRGRDLCFFAAMEVGKNKGVGWDVAVSASQPSPTEPTELDSSSSFVNHYIEGPNVKIKR